MAVLTEASPGTTSPEEGAPASRAASPLFEWSVVGASLWLVAGAHLDSWAHTHIGNLETFFTPWHAVLYSGFVACAVALGVPWVRAVRAGASWRQALPRGYGLSLIGCALFAIGGVLDMLWHVTFGIERGFAALLSPTHLVLIGSSGIIVAGPWRAAWHRPLRRLSYSALASAALTLSMVTFFLQFDHPYTSQWAAGSAPFFDAVEMSEALGVLGIILQSLVMMTILLLLVTRFDLPPGSIATILTVNALFVTSIKSFDPIVVLVLAVGVVGDVLLLALRPSERRPKQLRAFAFLLPAVLYALYFPALMRVDGVWWEVHFWTGSILLAGIVGVLVSYVVLPPERPTVTA